MAICVDVQESTRHHMPTTTVDTDTAAITLTYAKVTPDVAISATAAALKQTMVSTVATLE
jgi:hypothetical protein